MTNGQDIPTLYLHPHSAANEPVTLHTGPIVLRVGARTSEGTGRLVLGFLPSTGLRLDVEIASGAAPDAGSRVQADVAGGVADALVNSVRVGFEEERAFCSIEAGISSFETGTTSGLASVGFQVLNFTDFLTPGPKAAPVFGFSARVTDLQADGWRVRLTAVNRSKDIFKSLDEIGGYAFTHLGLVERVDGGLFDSPQADTFLNTLASFLSFARGAACSLPVRWGIDAGGSVVWHCWGSPIVDAWKTSETWFDEQHGNLLTELFPAFHETSVDPDLGEPLKLALHWYQRSNMRAGGMEGAIILGVTNLDLLSALVVVDRNGSMTDSNFDGLKAREKLARLLAAMNVPSTIPPRLSELTTFAGANGWADATVALAEIRHGYVHPNKKRRKIVMAAPRLATFQAWRLSLWYQELAILHFLKHRGEYRNRLTAEWRGIVERVPWI